jgi:hypothetical protein
LQGDVDAGQIPTLGGLFETPEGSVNRERRTAQLIGINKRESN